MSANILNKPTQTNEFYDTSVRWNLNSRLIFVFGSNLRGVHGAGAAKEAVNRFGAVPGYGQGHHGQSYAIPTKDINIQTLHISFIKEHVAKFVQYTLDNPQLSFYVTPVGTGLAGYQHHQIAPMFKGAQNCWFPESWKQFLA